MTTPITKKAHKPTDRELTEDELASVFMSDALTDEEMKVVTGGIQINPMKYGSGEGGKIIIIGG
jgi:hypothetical protein